MLLVQQLRSGLSSQILQGGLWNASPDFVRLPNVTERLTTRQRTLTLHKIGDCSHKLLHEDLDNLLSENEHKDKVCLQWWNLIIKNHVWSFQHDSEMVKLVHPIARLVADGANRVVMFYYFSGICFWMSGWLNMLNLVIRSSLIVLWSFCFPLPFIN